MSHETILTNARIVGPDAVFPGTLVFRDGLIAEVSEEPSRAPGAVDCDGDYLIPGMVELHTDNLDKHVSPRPKVRWPAESAVVAHDAQIATAGITTVFDSVAIGEIHHSTDRLATLSAMIEGLDTCRQHGMLRVEHFVHLRCELSHAALAGQLEALADQANLRLLSLMDHTPGQRQFTTRAQYENYYKKKYQLDDRQLDEFVQRALRDREAHGDANRARVIEIARARNLPIASHDDATPAHAAEAAEAGAVLAEFPTTDEAAEALRGHGISILTGAPNVVRGESHSGNVSALALAAKGLVDILSSDYVPASLLPAAFRVARDLDRPLHEAIRLVSANPAAALGLADRGRIEPGLRADVIRVVERRGLPLVRTVWVQGERVA